LIRFVLQAQGRQSAGFGPAVDQYDAFLCDNDAAVGRRISCKIVYALDINAVSDLLEMTPRSCATRGGAKSNKRSPATPASVPFLFIDVVLFSPRKFF
jgi:hypothetical protein